MLKQLIHTLRIPQHIAVVQVQMQDPEIHYAVLELVRKGSDISIKNRNTFTDFEEMVKRLPKNRKIILAFTGKRIVNRKVHQSDNYKSSLIFNADPSDFYFDVQEGEAYNFVSYTRSEWISEEIEKFRAQELFVIDFAIGPFKAASLAPFINAKTIAVSNVTLFFEEGNLKEFTRENHTAEDIFIEEEKLNKHEALMFAVGLRYFLGEDTEKSKNPILSGNKTTYAYKKSFYFLGVFLLVFFLSTLLLSRILMSVYGNKNMSSQQKIIQNQYAYDLSKKLLESKAQKKRILNATGVFSTHFLSYYTHCILKNMPEGIQLSNMEVFPLTGKVKAGKTIERKLGVLKVEGNLNTGEELGAWIKTLNTLPWIRKINITGLEDVRNGSKTFQLEISIQNDL